jgi:hypothetical protein
VGTPVQVPPVAHAREELPVAVSPYGLTAVGVGTLLEDCNLVSCRSMTVRRCLFCKEWL